MEVVGHCHFVLGRLRRSDIARPEVVVLEGQRKALPGQTNAWVVLEEAGVELSCRTGGIVPGLGAATNRTFSKQRRMFGNLMCVVVDGEGPVRSLDNELWHPSTDLIDLPTDLQLPVTNGCSANLREAERNEEFKCRSLENRCIDKCI